MSEEEMSEEERNAIIIRLCLTIGIKWHTCNQKFTD
jgi:hypothetical protein